MTTERFANQASTTLSSAIGSGDLSISVQAATNFPGSPEFRVRLGQELMLVTGVVGTTWTVTRGVEGTTAASHAIGTAVVAVLTGGGLDEMRAEIEAEDRTASGIRTASTVVAVSSATAPSVGQVLTATSSTGADWENPPSISELSIDSLTPTLGIPSIIADDIANAAALAAYSHFPNQVALRATSDRKVVKQTDSGQIWLLIDPIALTWLQIWPPDMTQVTQVPGAQYIMHSDLISGTGNFTPGGDTTYFVYCGYCAPGRTPLYVNWQQTTLAVLGTNGDAVFEAGIFTSPAPPNKNNQVLTKLTSISVAAVVTTTGPKRNTVAMSTPLINGGHIWATTHFDAGTGGVPTVGQMSSLYADRGRGSVLRTTSSGPLSSANTLIGSVISNPFTNSLAPDLAIEFI